MKPITVTFLLIASIPFNYFAFDFANKNIESIPLLPVPSTLNEGKTLPTDEVFCKNNSNGTLNEKKNNIIGKYNDAKDNALNMITKDDKEKDRDMFLKTIREKIDIEWRDLAKTHFISKGAYGNCYVKVDIQLSSIGSFQAIDIAEKSGNERFDDIAFLTLFHTDFQNEFNLMPVETKEDIRNFSLEFKL